MKKSLKLALTAAAVIATTSAFAAHVTQPLHHKLLTKTAATQPNGIIIGGDWMFLRPSNYASDIGTATYEGSNVAVLQTKTIDHSLQGASHLFVGYGNVNNGSSIQLAWTHLDTARSDRFPGAPSVTFNPAAGQGVTASGRTASLYGYSSYDYDAVDLTLTKAMQSVGKLDWQVFAGVRYAEIDHDLNTSTSQIISLPILSNVLAEANQNYGTDFRGFGPRFGINANYALCHGVKVFGQLAVSLLYSELTDKLNSDVFVEGNNVFVSATSYSQYLNRDGIVPNFDAQLGLSYDHPFHGAIVGVRAGYQIDYYHDATAQVTNNGAHVENVSFSGPFVGLVVHG